MTAQIRSMKDRRSGKDRRRLSFLKRLFGRTDSRAPGDRRTQPERRDGWVRFTKWSSVYLNKLKISKFLDRS